MPLQRNTATTSENRSKAPMKDQSGLSDGPDTPSANEWSSRSKSPLLVGFLAYRDFARMRRERGLLYPRTGILVTIALMGAW